ncbi:NUDIX hydrolase [Aldersonia kunmingensis]|uniref:NUDIX hydrolase n=1 Tax=Aldersonia kunmingensis TaxID=408066 RepID=UPI000836A55D|nr:NUDIX hydrolase [Aldersonia kunmingensis]
MALTDYPRPSVAVDTAVLTFDDNRLAVLAVHGPGGAPVLPGKFLRQGKRLREAASDALTEKAGLRTDVVEQIEELAMFDDPNRDDRGWVLSMAHTVAVPRDRLPDDAILIPVIQGAAREALGYDHNAMVVRAVTHLRSRYAEKVDPAHFLGDMFTVLDLRRLYEAIFERRFPKDTFRRHVLDGLLSTGETTVAGRGRPAELFRRSGSALPPTAVAAFLHNPR